MKLPSRPNRPLPSLPDVLPPVQPFSPHSQGGASSFDTLSPRQFGGEDLLDLWEAGAAQHPLDRGLTILAWGYPQAGWDTLADLSAGQRDGLLLDLYAGVFGEHMRSQAECPFCRCMLEFELDVRLMRIYLGANGRDGFLAANAVESRFQACSADGVAFEYRLPNSRDLAALVAEQPEDGARFLARRCILKAGPSMKVGGLQQNEAPIDVPDALLDAFSVGIAAHDPLADICLDLVCPQCANAWQLGFDILDFFWVEIQAQAKRLARQVLLLARSYGWSERDILQISPARRRLYLELLET